MLVNSKYPSLVDISARAGVVPGRIIEQAGQMNPMLEDGPAMPCNRGVSHETTVRTGLPQGIWGMLYQGIPEDKSEVQSFRHTPGYLEGAIQIDRKVVDEVENNPAFASMTGEARSNAIGMERTRIMQQELSAYAQGLSIQAAEALLYGNQKTNPKGVTGFMAFFNDRMAQNGSQIVDGGGRDTADNTSLLLVTWHESTCHFIYPAGGKQRAGFTAKPVESTHAYSDVAKQVRYNTYRQEVRWDLGLTPVDWRYIVRIANIDVSNMLANGQMEDIPAGTANLINLMDSGYYRHFARRVNVGKTCWYGGTTMIEYLDYQARNTPKNLWLSFQQTGVNADEVLMHRKRPIKESDAFLHSEAAVPFV